MTEEEKWEYILQLDDELLVGGAILSEWCTFVVRDAEMAFARGANLASVVTSVAAIETHLRYERAGECRETLCRLIDVANIDDHLRIDLHTLRRYRNKWVHVDDPDADGDILADPAKYEDELEAMAMFGLKTMLRTVYSGQWL